MNALSSISRFLRCMRVSVHVYWKISIVIFTFEVAASFAAVILSLVYAISSLPSGVDGFIICGMLSGAFGVMAALYSYISMHDRKTPFWFSLVLQDFVAIAIIITGAMFSSKIRGLECTIYSDADVWALMTNPLINSEFEDTKEAAKTHLFVDTCGSNASQICPELYKTVAVRCSGLKYLRISYGVQAVVCAISVVIVAIEYYIYWGVVQRSNARMERARLARQEQRTAAGPHLDMTSRADLGTGNAMV